MTDVSCLDYARGIEGNDLPFLRGPIAMVMDAHFWQQLLALIEFNILFKFVLSTLELPARCLDGGRNENYL